MKKDIQDNKSFIEQLITHLEDVLFVISPDWQIVHYISSAYETLWGQTCKYLMKNPLSWVDSIHPEDKDTVIHYVKEKSTMGKKEEIIFPDYRIIRPDGSTRWISARCFPITNDKGEFSSIAGIATDITERKSNEMALLAATRAAEAANKTKGLFLAKVSHEIRTPMTAIVGFSELLEDAVLTSEERRYVEAIQSSAYNLSSLLKDILDISKVDAGELVIKQKEFNLHKLITELVSSQKKQMATKDFSFTLSIDNNVPELLIGDALRIRQVLLNMLDNAIKFTEKGEVGIVVSVTEETDRLVMLDIAVKDTGVGISDSMQKCIFDPFVQAHEDSPHTYGGTGLGLAISRSLADLMGGSLRVESQKGVGSEFHLLIPMQRTNDIKSKKIVVKKGPLTWNGPPLNILLAEDNPINSLFIETVLENMGHTVRVAENGRVALETLKENNFDVALMDIQMPLISGVDVLSVIRKREEHSGKHLNVIALTAHSFIGDQEKFLEMGFDGYLSKPFKQKDLMYELKRIVLD